MAVGGGEREADALPRSEQPALPPQVDVRLVEVQAVRRLGIVLQRGQRVERHAHALAVDRRRLRAGDAPQHRGQPVAPGAGHEHGPCIGRHRLVTVAEQHLRHAEHVLVDGPALVLHVRAAVGAAHVPPLKVEGHVEQHEVEHHRRGGGDGRVVGPLDERQERRDVLLVVDVRVPLAEAEAGLLGDPAGDERLGVAAVLGARAAVVGKRGVGEGLPGQVLAGVEDDPVVLGPVPLVVPHAGRRGLGEPVLERQQPPLDVGDERGVEAVPVAVPERHELEQVEVTRVLHPVELGEHGRQVDGPGRLSPLEAGDHLEHRGHNFGPRASRTSRVCSATVRQSDAGCCATAAAAARASCASSRSRMHAVSASTPCP